MTLKFLLSLFFILFIWSCSPTAKKEQVSQQVHKQFLISKEHLKQKKFKEAEDALFFLKDDELSEREKIEKFNLLGIINFQRNQFHIAKTHFEKALSFNFDDTQLREQVDLNLASSDYKLGLLEESYKRSMEIDAKELKASDQIKLYLLLYAIGQSQKLVEKQYYALLLLNSQPVSEEEYAVAKYAKNLNQLSLTLTPELKIKELTKLKEKNYYVVVREVKNIIDEYKRKGQEEEAEKLASWVETSAQINPEVAEENVPSQWERKKIGVVLPLTGEKSNYAKSVLTALSLANELSGKNYQFVVRDSQDTPSIAVNQIRDLVLNEYVSIIIGGLFPTTAQHEYRISSKLSTAFISLAPVYLPRQFKENLLFEVAGSVESQVHALLKEETKKKLGSKFALFYADDQNGHAYLEEFWDKSKSKGFTMVTQSSYPKNLADYREYIKDFFGLKFPRERAEEYGVWYDIRLAQFKSNIKRAQILSPQFDFDWIFITANPLEVVQIIPSFKYIEVERLPFVGGPQWRSSHLVKNNEVLGNLIFVDNVESQRDAKFQQAYKEKFINPPRYVESLSFDAMWLAHQLLDSNKSSSRFSFKGSLIDLRSTRGYLSEWFKEDGIWMKSMDLNQITSSGIGRL